MRVCDLVGIAFERIETTVERSGEEGPVRLRMAVAGTQIDTGFVDSMESAVDALQRALPPGAAVSCCRSCAHGNFCPVGDAEDEIFCMADIAPRTIRDIWRVTEDEAEREKRARRLLLFCDRWRENDESLYGYNDWNDRRERNRGVWTDPIKK